MKKNIIFLVLLSLALTACGAYNEVEAQMVATEAAMGTPPPPKYQTAAAIYLGLTLTPTPSPVPYGTPTMSMQDYSMTVVAQQQANSMTQHAEDLELEREKIAAEQKAEAAKTEAARAEKTAEAINVIRTQQAQATSAQATAYWQATATQQGLVFIQQTQAAHGVETQRSAEQTAVVEPTHAMWTATAVYIQQRIDEGKARDVELAVRRQEMKNGFDAYGPWLMVIFVAIVSSEGFRKWLKTRVFKRDEHGKMPVVALEKEDGKTAIVKIDAMPGAAMTVDSKGSIDTPVPLDREEQKDVTRRTQAVEAISFMPAPYAQQAVKTMNTEFGVGQKNVPNIRIGNKAMNPVLDEAEATFLEENL
ncbi:MAG: hypothetical protein ACOYZ6_07970 [Chloroflexota bacterium]